LRKALARHGRPGCITIDGSQTNRMAIAQCDTESQLMGKAMKEPPSPFARINI
jgi:hypothetical protein